MSLRAANSLLTNTTAIRGGSEQNSKQPNVHGCTFGCDGIRAASELTSLSMLGREFACCKLTSLTVQPSSELEYPKNIFLRNAMQPLDPLKGGWGGIMEETYVVYTAPQYKNCSYSISAFIV